MSLLDFKSAYPHLFFSELRWGEMDAMQHLNNVMYYRYFESGRMAYWEMLKKEVESLVPSFIGPIVAFTNCYYKKPLYYPDRVVVGTAVKSIDDDRFVLAHALFSEKNQCVAANGEVLVVCFDYEKKTKVPVPKPWREFFNRKNPL